MRKGSSGLRSSKTIFWHRHRTVPAQFPSSTYEKAEPDAVVMTYGADDVKFSSIAK